MITLQKLADELAQVQLSQGYSSETIRTLKEGLKPFLKWLQNAHGIDHAIQLQRAAIEQYQHVLSKRTNRNGLPLTAKYLNNHIWAVRHLLRYLHKQGYMTSDYSKHLVPMKERFSLPKVISHKQVKKMIRGVDTQTHTGYRNRAILELLYSSGIRNGELVGLTIDDIDFSGRQMKVTGKGSKERIVPIGKTALRLLESYLRGIRPFCKNADRSRSLFLTERGNSYARHNLQRMVKKYAAEQLPDEHVTPHTFRRSCTTELIKGNANLYHVKELLGHESLDTLKPYTRLSIDDLKKTHAKCHPREREPG